MLSGHIIWMKLPVVGRMLTVKFLKLKVYKVK
jgi:hypothetical protein